MTAKKATPTPRKPPAPAPAPPADGLLDLEAMTIDEAIWFEEASGVPVDEIFDAKGQRKASKMQILKGAAYIALKQGNPHATIADAGSTKLVAVKDLRSANRGPMSPPEGD